MAQDIQYLPRIVKKTMDLLRSLGLHSLAWPLRRLYCPVSPSALVLEVGSGGNPFPRSDILLDAYEDTRERHWEPLCKDRPVVLGFVEQLPFKDKAFDYVIACHVLEHSSDPARFLNELQRVSKAGYIEVPSAFMERIVPYLDHKLEIMKKDQKLLINKKSRRIIDSWFIKSISPEINDLLSRTLRRNPFDFHTQLYWQEKIEFEIVNEGQQFFADAADASHGQTLLPQKTLRRRILNSFSRVFKGGHEAIDFKSFLQCPTCKNDSLKTSANRSIECPKCLTEIKVIENQRSGPMRPLNPAPQT